MYVMRRLVKGLNKVGCACFFVALRWWVILNCWNFKIVFRNVADGRCRECCVKEIHFVVHVSQRLNEAMAFIDGDGNGETKMLCEFVASRSQRVH